MLDNLDAWANGETIAPVAPAIAAVRSPRVSRRARVAAAPSRPLPGVVTSSHPFGDSEIAWLAEAGNNGFGFAISIMRQMRMGRTLTANQIETVQRLTREHAAKLAAKLAPVADAAPEPISAPVVTPANPRAGSMGSVQATPAPVYTAPAVAVPADTLESATLSPTPISTNWPVLFSTPEGNSVADCGAMVLCIAAAGLPVKFARFNPAGAPNTVTINESVWRDFVSMSRADFIANHLA